MCRRQPFHRHLAVTSDVYGPKDPRHRLAPLFHALAVEKTQRPLRPQEEALLVRGDSHTAGSFILPQLQRLAVECGSLSEVPPGDIQSWCAGHWRYQSRVQRAVASKHGRGGQSELGTCLLARSQTAPWRRHG